MGKGIIIVLFLFLLTYFLILPTHVQAKSFEVNITIDGFGEDWEGIEPIINDAYMEINDDSSDIKSVKAFVDDDNLYLLIDTVKKVGKRGDFWFFIQLDTDNDFKEDYHLGLHRNWVNLEGLLGNIWNRHNYITVPHIADLGWDEIVELKMPLSLINLNTDFNLRASSGDFNSPSNKNPYTDWSRVRYNKVKPRMVVLANSIDYELASDFVDFLKNRGIDTIHATASDFEQYKDEKFIVMLGGPDAYEGVGEIVQEILTEDEQNVIRGGGNQKRYLKTDPWDLKKGQRVTILAGSDRDQTKMFHNAYMDDVSSEVVGASAISLVDDDPSIGPENAPVTIVEFSDFQCSYCANASLTVHKIIDTYGDNIRFVYRDFPIISLHGWAREAAEAAECADDQGKFWEYHDKNFANYDDFSGDSWKQFAKDLGLVSEKFDECLDSYKYAYEVKKDWGDGILADVNGTPTFFINSHVIEGAQPFATFQEFIEVMMNPYPKTFSTYKNSDYRIRIKYPTNWTKQKKLMDGFVLFSSPKKGELDKYAENVNVMIEDLSADPMTLEEYTNIAIDQLSLIGTDFTIISSTETTLGESPANKIIYTFKLGKFDFKYMQIFTIKNDLMYAITYSAEENIYPLYLGTVQEMIDSFEIISVFTENV